MAKCINDYSSNEKHGWGQYGELRVNRRRKTIKCEFYDAIYFKNLPEGKYDYYIRHSDYDICKPASVKKNKGLTVNFWGTIVTDEPINFNGKDELPVVAYINYDPEGCI